MKDVNLTLEKELELFGYAPGNESLKWVNKREDELDFSVRFELEKAESLGAKAVYFRYFPDDQNRDPVPQVYIYYLQDEGNLENLRYKLWNASPAPLVYVFLENRIEIFDVYSSEFQKEKPNQSKVSLVKIVEQASSIEKAISEAAPFSFDLVDSGLFWDSDKAKTISTKTSSYESLLSDLHGWKEKALIGQANKGTQRTIKKVLLSILLLKYLEERQEDGISAINPTELYGQWATDVESPKLEDVFSLGFEMVFNLFDDLSTEQKFNGAIFTLSQEEKSSLAGVDCGPFIEFLKVEMDPTGQYRLPFWGRFQFRYLPIELISAIYEDFLATEDGEGKKDTGVVYTPPTLVQFLIDQMMPIGTPNLEIKVLDPACGSGIFLVGAFKRLVQWWRIKNGMLKPSKENEAEIKGLLTRNIFGADIKEEAVDIAYFSLSLALFDAFSPKEILKQIRFEDLRGKNLFNDFFNSPQLPTDFDLIIGNPPFKSKFTIQEAMVEGQLAKEAKENKIERPDLPDNQLALLFLEYSIKHLKQGGKTCFLLPSTPVLYNLSDPAIKFRKYLIEKIQYETIYDFTALRQTLFKRWDGEPSAQPSVVALVTINQTPKDESFVNHLILRRTQAAKQRLMFEVDFYDTFTIGYKEAKANPRVWQTNFWGGGRLRFLVEKIKSFKSLAEFLEDKKKNASWDKGEGWIEDDDHPAVFRAYELFDKPNRSFEENIELKKLERSHFGKWIQGFDFVETENFRKFGLEIIKKCDKRYFLRPRVRTRKIFEPPHLLIHENASQNRDKLNVVLSDKYLTFKDQIVGIHAPKEDINKLIRLRDFLVNPDILTLTQIFSGKVFTNREGVPTMSDIMSLPYSEEPIEFSEFERVVLEDLKEFHIPFRNNTDPGRSLKPVTNNPDLLGQYSHWFCKVLNTVYKDFTESKRLMGDDFIMMAFCLGEPKSEIKFPESIDELSDLLKEISNNEVSFNFRISRLIQYYIHNYIIFLKPNQQRYWTRSIAMRDADFVFTNLVSKGF